MTTMSDILRKLESIDQRINDTKREAADKGHFFIIIALVVLLTAMQRMHQQHEELKELLAKQLAEEVQ